MMREAGGSIDGIGVHYYTMPVAAANDRPATGFNEDDWASTPVRTLRMDEILTKHAQVMDKHDPEKRVALLVDEWGHGGVGIGRRLLS
jgi:alpha-N-arabinofuranosidase